MSDKPAIYRELIDALVKTCASGQGRIGADRVRAGVWNRNPAPAVQADQQQMNALLAGLSAADR